MRRTPLVHTLWAWLLAAPILAAADDDGPPIPQDPAAMKRRSAAWLAWNRQTLGDAYRQVGKRDPRWDKAAELALDRAARLYSLQLNPLVTIADVHTPARRAVEAGCDDPLILYVYAVLSLGTNFPGQEESLRRHQAASDAMSASRYPPLRKGSALLRATQSRLQGVDRPPTPEESQAVEAALDGIFDQFRRSIEVDPRGEFWEARWHDILEAAMRLNKWLGPDPKQAFDRFDARMAQSPKAEALRLALKGKFLVDWAWAARSDRLAALVSEKQFQTFGGRLEEARSALEQAYRLNPRQPNVARAMLTVAKGAGDDRAAMETWFRRAMELDPNDQDACADKLSWLAPKWHGDPEGREMAAFGKACAATGNWASGITLVSADAIYNRSFSLPPAERTGYWARPEVADAVAAVYDQYLKHYPDDALALSKYAYYSSLSNRFAVSDRMFERAGANLTTWYEGPATLAELRKVRLLVGLAARLKK